MEKQTREDLIKVEKVVESKVKLKKLCKKILQQVKTFFLTCSFPPY